MKVAFIPPRHNRERFDVLLTSQEIQYMHILSSGVTVQCEKLLFCFNSHVCVTPSWLLRRALVSSCYCSVCLLVHAGKGRKGREAKGRVGKGYYRSTVSYV